MKKTTIIGLILLSFLALTPPTARTQSVPEDARRHMVRGQAAVEMAKSSDEYEPALKEFAEAARLAPNWPDPYYNLALLQEKTGKLKEAVASLREYLRLVPNAPDAAKIRDRMYNLEYRIEKGEQKSSADSAIDGFAGVPWGATKQQVKVIMAQKGFKEDTTYTDASNTPSFAGLAFRGPFANRMCNLLFYFKGNALVGGTVKGQKWSSGSPALEEYNYFFNLVKEKYGAPQKREQIPPNQPKGLPMPHAEWELRGSASDKYLIRAFVCDAYYQMPAGRQIFQFMMSYDAETLARRLKEDGI